MPGSGAYEYRHELTQPRGPPGRRRAQRCRISREERPPSARLPALRRRCTRSSWTPSTAATSAPSWRHTGGRQRRHPAGRHLCARSRRDPGRHGADHCPPAPHDERGLQDAAEQRASAHPCPLGPRWHRAGRHPHAAERNRHHRLAPRPGRDLADRARRSAERGRCGGCTCKLWEHRVRGCRYACTRRSPWTRALSGSGSSVTSERSTAATPHS